MTNSEFIRVCAFSLQITTALPLPTMFPFGDTWESEVSTSHLVPSTGQSSDSMASWCAFGCKHSLDGQAASLWPSLAWCQAGWYSVTALGLLCTMPCLDSVFSTAIERHRYKVWGLRSWGQSPNPKGNPLSYLWIHAFPPGTGKMRKSKYQVEAKLYLHARLVSTMPSLLGLLPSHGPTHIHHHHPGLLFLRPFYMDWLLTQTSPWCLLVCA